MQKIVPMQTVVKQMLSFVDIGKISLMDTVHWNSLFVCVALEETVAFF